jgi:hypothetical protein
MDGSRGGFQAELVLFPRAQEILAEAGYTGKDVAAYRDWLGLRARRRVGRAGLKDVIVQRQRLF